MRESAESLAGRLSSEIKVPHLLVTNDFPPKIGGIQSYLWELWRRLPSDQFTVLTSPHAGAADFDAKQPFRVVRCPEPVLLPSPIMTRRVRRLAQEVGAELVIIDPAFPLGLIGPHLDMPYGVVLHGAEVTVPGRLLLTRSLLARAVAGASVVISAGGYPEREGKRALRGGQSMPPVVRVPPGVDTSLFVPISDEERAACKKRLGLDPDLPLVLSVSRLVPRKGMDTLIKASALLKSRSGGLQVAIAGSGRDRKRLDRLVASSKAPVHLLGRVPGEDLSSLYAAADVFVLCCRNRWGGLEQEGFGIVLMEAASCGVPAVAGDSGGAAEAVVQDETGVIVHHPTDPKELAAAIGALLDNPAQARAQGEAGRVRALEQFDYDVLARRLMDGLRSALVGEGMS